MSKQPEWAMPEWMKPLEQYICNTGGNPVTEMMNGNADPFINLPLSTLQACVKSQVILLNTLHKYEGISQHLDPAVKELVEAAGEAEESLRYVVENMKSNDSFNWPFAMREKRVNRLESALKPFGGE